MTNVLAVVMLACIIVEGNPSGKPTDGGRTHGRLCISRAAVEDVNKRYRTHYRWSDVRHDRLAAADVFQKYVTMWGANTPESIARIHNGGPTGMRKASARAYWKKVAAELLSPKMKGRYMEAVARDIMEGS